MSHAEVVEETTAAVADLDLRSSYRPGGLCEEQVERLVLLGGVWPPILVDQADGRVIDGAHRVAAARRLGLARLPVEWFDGRPDEAFVEFVRRNVTQGLVLSIAERKQAALRILEDHPIWSDRRVAELCALSPKTVARVRVDVPGRPSADEAHLDVREGRDHRLRPVQAGSARTRVLAALREQPEGSLRTIAAAAGVSPETVRLVRLNLDQLDEPEAPAWQDDAALASATDGADFAAWFEETAVTDDDLERAPAVPLSRVYLVADEARRRSETWLQFARALEARPGR